MDNNSSKYYYVYFGVILAVGLMAASFILGSQFKNFRQQGVITVKGLAESQHKATLATWRLSATNWNSDYKMALEENKKELSFLVNFIKQQGFKPEEIKVNNPRIETHYESYEDERGNYKSITDGYDASTSIVISSKNLALIEKVQRKLQEMKGEHMGIQVNNPEYYLENLEQIKRELIAKATEDALVRAEEFAKTGKAKVGSMKSASQGSFNIYSDTPGDNSDDIYGGVYDTSTVGKVVRLVVTIEYEID